MNNFKLDMQQNNELKPIDILSTHNYCAKHSLVAGYPSSESPITIEKLSASYMQEGDANSTAEQFLEICTENVGAGIYYIIKTERWSFDNLNDFIKILNDFEKRLTACH